MWWDSGVCGGIAEFSNIQTCVVESYTVKKYVIKEPILPTERIYISNPFACGNRTLYLIPCLSIHMFAKDFFQFLLFQDRTVDTWYSLQVRLPYLDKEPTYPFKLVIYIDQFLLLTTSRKGLFNH